MNIEYDGGTHVTWDQGDNWRPDHISYEGYCGNFNFPLSEPNDGL